MDHYHVFVHLRQHQKLPERESHLPDVERNVQNYLVELVRIRARNIEEDNVSDEGKTVYKLKKTQVN